MNNVSREWQKSDGMSIECREPSARRVCASVVSQLALCEKRRAIRECVRSRLTRTLDAHTQPAECVR